MNISLKKIKEEESRHLRQEKLTHWDPHEVASAT